MRKKFFMRLWLTYCAVALFALSAVGVALGYLLERYVVGWKAKEMVSRGKGVASLMEKVVTGEQSVETASSVLDVMDEFLGSRIYVFSAAGSVVAKSRRGPPLVRGALRQVVLQKLARTLEGEVTVVSAPGPSPHRDPPPTAGWRYQEPGLWVGVPVGKDGTIIGALVMFSPLTDARGLLADLRRLVAYAGAAAVLVSGATAYLISRRVVRPVVEMARVARMVAEGNFKERVKVEGDDEISALARAFNMAVDATESALKEMKNLERLRREFAADVSHEFRSPLATIRGYAEALLDGVVPEGERDRYLQVLLEEAGRLSRLVDDMLQLETLEAPEFHLDIQPTDPGEAISSAVEAAEPKAREAGVPLLVEVADGLPPVAADPIRLAQILGNLLDNAIRFSPTGKPVTVGADLREAPDADGAKKNRPRAVRFWVKDEGPGIPPEDIPRIWDRFYKVDKARQRKDRGTGLGLAIVKQLVTLHGGEVDVETAPGAGARFTFALPAYNPDNEVSSGSAPEKSRGIRFKNRAY